MTSTTKQTTTTTTQSTTTQTALPSDTAHKGILDQSDINRFSKDYEEERRGVWPYRTDDKYSLFYYQPSETKDEPVYFQEDFPEDYQIQLSSKESDNLNLSQDDDSGRLSEPSPSDESPVQYVDSSVLEIIFICVTFLVVFLLIILITISAIKSK